MFNSISVQEWWIPAHFPYCDFYNTNKSFRSRLPRLHGFVGSNVVIELVSSMSPSTTPFPAGIMQYCSAMIMWLLSFLILGAHGTCEWILTAETACFSATSFSTDYKFNPIRSGNVTAVKLIHSSGSIRCTYTAYTNWGCYAAIGDWFGVQIVRHSDDALVDTVFPTNNTKNVTWIQLFSSCSSGHGCSVHKYFMNGDGVSENELLWIDDSQHVQVTESDIFSLQYSEGCCGQSTGDNSGTSCADVYFQYDTTGFVPKWYFDWYGAFLI